MPPRRAVPATPRLRHRPPGQARRRPARGTPRGTRPWISFPRTTTAAPAATPAGAPHGRGSAAGVPGGAGHAPARSPRAARAPSWKASCQSATPLRSSPRRRGRHVRSRRGVIGRCTGAPAALPLTVGRIATDRPTPPRRPACRGTVSSRHRRRGGPETSPGGPAATRPVSGGRRRRGSGRPRRRGGRGAPRHGPGRRSGPSPPPRRRRRRAPRTCGRARSRARSLPPPRSSR